MISIFKRTFWFIMISGIFYLLFSFFNWDLHPGEWHWFFRVVYGFGAFVALITAIFGGTSKKSKEPTTQQKIDQIEELKRKHKDSDALQILLNKELNELQNLN